MNIDHLQRVFIWEKAMAFENLIMKLDKKEEEIFVSFVFYFFIFYKKIAVAAIVKGDQNSELAAIMYSLN